MSKVLTTGRFLGGTNIASNSLDIVHGDLLAIKSGFVEKAVAWDEVVGVSTENKTYSATNETVEQGYVEYAKLADDTQIQVEVEGWTIAQANVWANYDLNANSVVDATTVWVWTTLKLVKVVTTTLGNFIRV